MRAILIEPNPLAFSRLQKLYANAPNVTLVPVAVSDRDGECDFFRLKSTAIPENEVDMTLLYSSFYKEHITLFGYTADQIEKIKVPCRSLASLATEMKWGKIDLLQIDAEGYDATLVRLALEMPAPPVCINFEHGHIPAEDRPTLYAQLAAQNYLLSYSERDILALHRSVLEASA